MTEVRNRRRASYQVLLAILWLTLLVLAVKIWAGWATRSLSLLAESLHTLIDGFSTILSLIAISVSRRTVEREVWGHDKQEAAGAFLLVSFLGFAGFSLIIMSVQQLEAITHGVELPFPVQINLQLIQLLAVTVAINFALAWFERYEARLLESTPLRLNANHVLRDAWLTILVLAGLLGVWQGYVWLDPLMAIALVLMTIRSCWRVFNWQLPLMVRQVAIAPEVLAQIACQVEGVTHCRHIRSRGVVGRHVSVGMNLTLHPEFMGAAHTIAERVEGEIRERYGPVQVVIQLDSDRSKSAPSSNATDIENAKRRRSQADWN